LKVGGGLLLGCMLTEQWSVGGGLRLR